MEDFYTILYDPSKTDPFEISSILRSLQNLPQMEGKSILALPYIESLRKLDEDELRHLLKIYTKITEELLNE